MTSLKLLGCKSAIGLSLMLMMFIQTVLGFPSTQAGLLEEASFLRLIAKKYSAPLVVSFLHSRIQANEQIISKVKSAVKDPSKLDVIDLAEKTLKSLEEHLTTLEKADYFDLEGTEKIKHFIELLITQNELYPIAFGSYGADKGLVSPDALLEDLDVKTDTMLISSTYSMIQAYLTDIDEKEQSSGSNRMQKLAASIARRELQLLLSYEFPPTNNKYGHGGHDPCKASIEKVLKKVKTIVDFFYAQFNYLADQTSSDKMSEVRPLVEVSGSPNQLVAFQPVQSQEEGYYPFIPYDPYHYPMVPESQMAPGVYRGEAHFASRPLGRDKAKNPTWV